MATTTATIFYNDAKWFADEPCFDARFDRQILPSGSVACGFMVWDGVSRQVKELLAPPAMNKGQEQNYQQTIGEARGLLMGLPVALQ